MPAPPLPRRMVAPALLLVLALGTGLAGCSDDDTPPRTEVGDRPSTVTRGETTAPTSTAPSEPSRPTVFTDQARDAVNELKAAWEDGDQPRARAVAPGEVVDALFTVPPGGFEVYGCDTGEFDTSTCNLRNRSTGVYITLTSSRHAEGWQIATVYVDPG